MTTRAVIFDVDGTLVDSNQAHAQAWMDAFAAEGIAVTYDAVRRAIGMGGDKLMPAVAGIAADAPLGKRIAERRAREFKQRQLPRVKPFPGVRALAERLAADGYILAVASSAKEEELEPLLEIAGVKDLIAKSASSDDARASKPDPDIVEAALRASGVTQAHAIMLGDTPYDIEAATRAGIRIVAVECGGWSAVDLHGAVAIYANPADLLARYDSAPFSGGVT